MDYNFRVVRNIRSRRNKWIHETVITYELSYDKICDNNFRVEMRKVAFSTKDNQVVLGLAAAVIQEYTKVISPILFEVKEESLIVCNHEEIAQRIEIKKEELKLKQEYHYKADLEEGSTIDKFHIIDHIGDYYIDLLIKDGDLISKSYLELDMMKFLLLCMKKEDNNEDYNLSFGLSSLNFDIIWRGRKTFDSNANIISYNAKIANKIKLFEKFKKYAEAEEYYINMIEREKLIDSDFTHKVQFTPDGLDFEFSETKIKVNHDFYEYHETIYISPIKNKN